MLKRIIFLVKMSNFPKISQIHLSFRILTDDGMMVVLGVAAAMYRGIQIAGDMNRTIDVAEDNLEGAAEGEPTNTGIYLSADFLLYLIISDILLHIQAIIKYEFNFMILLVFHI